MSKLSLRMRLTILITVLLIFITGVLTLVLGINAQRMAARVTQMVPILPPVNIGDMDSVGFPASTTQSAAVKIYQTQSYIILTGIILSGSALTYIIASKIMHPLETLTEQTHTIRQQKRKRLSEQSDQIEVRNLSHSFNQLLDDLDANYALQKQFSAHAAHELNTPLTIMQTQLDVFNKETQHDTEDYEALINSNQRQITRLQNIVQNLLVLSNPIKTLNTETLDLNYLVEDVLMNLDTKIKEVNLQVDNQTEHIKINVNYDMMYQVFFNIIENSMKYSPHNSQVLISSKLRNNRAVIIFEDNGYGIETQHLENITQPFYRVNNARTQSTGGSGLGLSLVQQIVEQHQGQLDIQSNQRGTRIQINF